jgi:DNA-binding IclR family transcriptional regulator
MAYLPEEKIKNIIRDRGLPRVGVNTITHRDHLFAELTRICRRGYAQSVEETDLGARGGGHADSWLER